MDETYFMYLNAAPLPGNSHDIPGDVPVNEARSHLSDLVNAVDAGEYVYITRRGKRVAALVPVEVAERAEQDEDEYWSRRAKEARDRIAAGRTR